MSFNIFRELSSRLLRRTPKPASFERIRIRILSNWLLNKDESCSVIAFTAKSPREGVSTIVAGLARSFSSADIGNILVLDVSNSHHKHGVTNLLNTAQPAEPSYLTGVLTRNEDLGIDVITLSDDSHNIGARKNTHTLLEKLRENYNIILIDAGTLNSSTGTHWLVNSDYNVLVLDSSKTTREALEFQKKEFENSDISIDGSIINKREFPIPNSLYWLTR